MEWYKEEYDKYITWNDSNLTKLPFIIKHEYLRVFELLLNGQVYGVFFQIKDTFEIVLKSLILTVISEMLENNQLSGADNDIVFKLFEKALSLGDWEGISRLLKNKSQYSEINALINSIISIYGDNSITKWRNDFIGHGALPNSESEYFINEIRQKIKILQSYFEENIVHYEAIEYIPQKNTLVFKYKNDLIFDLKYFSYYENENIYIFDSFNSLKKKFAFLNYSNGRKSEIA